MTEYEITQAQRRFMYYWQGYPSETVVIDGQGSRYVTEKELSDAIEKAMGSIYLERADDDTLKLVVGGKEITSTVQHPAFSDDVHDDSQVGDKTNLIDDVYLTQVTTKENEDGERIVHFIRNNNKDDIEINVDELDPVLDMKTF